MTVAVCPELDRELHCVYTVWVGHLLQLEIKYSNNLRCFYLHT